MSKKSGNPAKVAQILVNSTLCKICNYKVSFPTLYDKNFLAGVVSSPGNHKGSLYTVSIMDTLAGDVRIAKNDKLREITCKCPKC